MTTKDAQFAYHVDRSVDQRIHHVQPHEAIQMAAANIPDEYDCDDIPELCGLDDDEIHAACIHHRGLMDRGAFDLGNVLVTLVITDEQWKSCGKQ